MLARLTRMAASREVAFSYTTSLDAAFRPGGRPRLFYQLRVYRRRKGG